MPSSPWCHSICISPKENYVVVGFDDAVVRFFNPSKSEEPREDRLHKYHKDCKQCPPVETLSFSQDGLVILASTRSLKNGMIQVYSWQMPSAEFQELVSCRYHVPLHESEDNGVSSATFRPGMGGEQHLVCLATWTQSGIPVLVQPQDGHRSEIRTDVSSHQGKLGSRIQCASFSPTGRELAMVNDKGYLYHISNLNSNPLEVRRIATSKELTTKSDAFAMTFMSGGDEEALILAWADSAKALGFVKKIPVRYGVSVYLLLCCGLYLME
jgi:WD40 repeat protein